MVGFDAFHLGRNVADRIHVPFALAGLHRGIGRVGSFTAVDINRVGQFLQLGIDVPVELLIPLDEFRLSDDQGVQIAAASG